jgi:hypothetical protein
MSRPPSYPKDAGIGSESREGGSSEASTSAGTAVEKAGDKAAGSSKRSKHLRTGAAIGIGSAAIVAALLYANRGRKNDR